MLAIKRYSPMTPALGMSSFPSIMDMLGASPFKELMGSLPRVPEAPYRVSTNEDGTTQIMVNLAGFSKDEVSVVVDEENKVLSISAENKMDELEDSSTDDEADQSESRSRGFYQSETSLTLSLPDDVDLENLKSTYKDGALFVEYGRVDKKAASLRQITIG